jgi:hypothetical protein
MGAEGAVAGEVPTRAAEREMRIQERHEARIARHDAQLAARAARHEAKLARMEARHAGMVQPYAASPTITDPSSTAASPAAPVARGAAVPSAPAINYSPILPSQTTNSTTGSRATTSSSATGSSTNSAAPLPANVSAPLQAIYQQYQDFKTSGGTGTFTPTGVNGVVISGTNVGINFHTTDTADFNATLAELQSDGLQVTTSSATYGVIDGMLPIAQLPAVAQISASASVTAMYHPVMM